MRTGMRKKRLLAGGKMNELFLGYFNNRMTVLLIMIEHPAIARNLTSVARQRFFLEDLYHHFLPPGTQPKYHRAFEWLFLFLKRYPNVTPAQIYRALEMVRLVYEMFGLELPPRMEAVRLEKEGMTRNDKRKSKKGPGPFCV